MKELRIVAIILFLLFGFCFSVSNESTLPQDIFLTTNMMSIPSQDIPIYLFWGDGCPHCMQEKIFLKKLQIKYPQIKVFAYEVWYSPENARLYKRMAKAFGSKEATVPATFISNRMWLGYREDISEQIEEKVRDCTQSICVKAQDILLTPTDQIKKDNL